MAGSMRLGGGGRFDALEGALAKEGARNPGALAAVIGRKKYGKAKMSKLAAAGKKREGSKAEEHGESKAEAKREGD